MTTARVAVSTANTTSYVTLLNVSGVDGVLTSVGVASGKNYHYFRITIDGATVVSDIMVGSNAQAVAANGGLGVALPFGNSLQVEIKDSPASPLTRYWAAYVTSHTQPFERPEIEVVEHEGQPYLRESAVFGEDPSSRYRIETLLGPMQRSRVELRGDYFLSQEPVAGSVLLEAGPLDAPVPVSVEGITLLVRPHGYRRVLDALEIGYVEGRRDFEYRGNELIRSGTFEIAAALDGFQNIPAVFHRS